MDENQLFIQITDHLSQGKLEQATTIADEAITQFPNSGRLHFIFAAISAQSEQYETAVQRYQEALQLEPELHIARFQLGLLLATLGQNEASISVLAPISEDTSRYLGCFSKSLILILTSENEEELKKSTLQQAIALLSEGITLNQENLHLNDDMRAMLSRIESELEEMLANDKTSEENAEESDQSHLLDVYHRPH